VIINKVNNKICKKCYRHSVVFQGMWERCYSCGEVYSKRDMEKNLDDIVLDAQINTGIKYFNKMFFFLTA